MSPLEKNIIDSLHLLSNEAKAKARIILGEKPSYTKKQKAVTEEDVRMAIYKSLKL
tara:strand:+ start:219 stop:386 length:168 start_codon:yes stop_codon:yes gene_type:complete